jgi:nucleoside-diphosphate-sugar epimerase
MSENVILVTGGAGAIGSRLVRRLCADDAHVLVLDDLSSGYRENLRGLPLSFWRGSVTDEELLTEIFAQQPSVVFHLAANFANQSSIDYPQKDLRVNGIGTLKLLEHARRAGVRRFVYASSSCIYGGQQVPLSESMTQYALKTPYAITKLLGEQYAAFYHQHHSLPTVILRFFNSYGPGERPGKYRNVIPNFIHRTLTGRPLTITGTGDETRDFTFVEDTVQALLLAQTHPDAIGQTFNVGTGQETTIRHLAELITQIGGSTVPIKYKPRRGWDNISRRCADITHISQTLGYRPSVEIEEGLRRTYAWFIEEGLDEYTPL